jgi:hypothetical protein
VDRAAVVAYRIDDGRRLLDRLIRDGLEVSAAFWMYTNDNERWGLYIATESVITIGIKNSYMIVVLAQKSMPELRIDSFEVTLLEPTRPLAAAMIDRLSAVPAGSDAWIEKVQLNGVYVEIAYVYPITTANGLNLPIAGEIEVSGSRAGW